MQVSIVRWFVVVGLLAHGIAHVVGFAVAWRLTTSPDVPYHTTLLSGRLDVGDTGMRAVGALWLASACAFVIGAILLATHSSVAIVTIAGVALASLVLCAMEWPFARIGMVVNTVVLIGLAAIRALV